MAFINVASAALGLSSGKKNTAFAGSIKDLFGGGSMPVDNSHTHSSKKNDTAVSAGADMGPKGGDSRFDLGDRNDSFMGKGQVENFSNLTDTSAVDRGGRAVDSSALDPVGIKPAMNPSLATPVDIDEQGINSLY